MTDRFAELLTELGDLLNTDLRPDVRGSCKISFDHHLQIQLENQLNQERILIACFICDVPPGKLRENILKDALKANWPSPIDGTLCYSERNNKLTLFLYVSAIQLNGQKLLSALTSFKTKAESWRTAVETGRTSHLLPSSKQPETNPFGIK
jgi:hypothetical protein